MSAVRIERQVAVADESVPALAELTAWAVAALAAAEREAGRGEAGAVGGICVIAESAAMGGSRIAADGSGVAGGATSGRGAGSREPAIAMTVRAVGREESRALNARWRGKDAETNVLAFPGDPATLVPGEPAHLGDLVVCAPVVAAEAREHGRSEAARWCHMVVHGTLHLAGYDHRTPPEAERMEALETGILTGLGYPDPWDDPWGGDG